MNNKNKPRQKIQGNRKQGKAGWYFFIIVITLYVILVILNPAKTALSFKSFFSLIIKITPTLMLIILLIGLFNYFVPPKKLQEWLVHGKGTNPGIQRIKAWGIAIIGGIVSSGPIYLWYPFLAQLRKSGVRNSLIATFLYNRAVKIPLVPMMIMYFGLAYTIILTIVTMIFSVFNGLLLEIIIDKKNY